MENSFVWILVFAGATIGLLGTFLISSERELKKKRRQIAELADQLEASQSSGKPHEAKSTQPSESGTAAELSAKNQELTEEIAALSFQLRVSQGASEELRAAQHQLSASHLENAELRSSHQRLQDEITGLKSQLEVTQTQPSESAQPIEEVAARQAQVEAENASLRVELEQCRFRMQSLEDAQAQRDDLASRESLMKEQQERLEQQVAQLGKELAVAREAIQELDQTRIQLQETDILRNQLFEDNQRLKQEISGWQERLADSEEQRRRLTALRQNLDDWRAKQAAVIESNRRLQEDLDALARFVYAPETFSGPEHAAGPDAASPVNGQAALWNEAHAVDLVAEPIPLNGDSAPNLVPEPSNTARGKRRRFGLFPAVVGLVAAGNVAAGFWG